MRFGPATVGVHDLMGPGFGTEISGISMMEGAKDRANEMQQIGKTVGTSLDAFANTQAAEAMGKAGVAAAGSQGMAAAAQGAFSGIGSLVGGINFGGGGGGGGFNPAPLGDYNPSGSVGNFAFSDQFKVEQPFSFNSSAPSFSTPSRFAGDIWS